ncbi:MAG: SH3 domain-containing protein [Natronohydrobacter sp.]|nr:SH3 domain-containing protein [Natronohydrobacter sp.]
MSAIPSIRPGSVVCAAILALSFVARETHAGEEEINFEVCVPTGGLLHLRSRPSSTSPSLGQMENGTTLTYISGDERDPDAWIKIMLFYLQTNNQPDIIYEGFVRPRMLADQCDIPHDPQLTQTRGSRFDGRDVKLGRKQAGTEPGLFDSASGDLGQSEQQTTEYRPVFNMPRLPDDFLDRLNSEESKRRLDDRLEMLRQDEDYQRRQRRLFDVIARPSRDRSAVDNHFAAISLCMRTKPDRYAHESETLASAGFETGEWGGIVEHYHDGLAILLSETGRFCDVASTHFGIQATEALVAELASEFNDILGDEHSWKMWRMGSGCLGGVRFDARMTVSSGGQDPICPGVEGNQVQYPDGDTKWGRDSAVRVVWDKDWDKSFWDFIGD